MKTTRVLVPAAVLFFLTILLFSWLPGSSDSEGRHSSKVMGSAASTQQSGSSEFGSGGNIRTKSKIRDSRHKPTIEETTQLLGATILPRLVVADATLEETVLELNRLIRETGVSSEELTIVIESDDASRDRPISGLRIRELVIRDIPVAVAIKWILDSTVLRCRTVEGRVEFWHGAYLPRSPEDQEPHSKSNPSDHSSSDPFAEP